MIPDWQFRAPAPRSPELMAPAPVQLMGSEVELMAPAPVEIMGLGEDGVHYGFPWGWYFGLSIPSAIISGVHGYKRNGDDMSYALVWGAFGFVFPIITPIVAAFQGFGKPAK